MKTNYRVLLIVAVFGVTLFTAAVNPHDPVYALGAGRFDSVEVNLAPGDDLFAGLRWRNIGPFHGGRIAAVTGAIGQPGVFQELFPIPTQKGLSLRPIMNVS